ncbi:slipin family protein [Sphingobacterium sp. LRF_L2]|uniref:slipin family protein n=1 Tax=Sphingobacterium sp. LRF_L2 TaxID=3369421 RepID=UPI003F5F729C
MKRVTISINHVGLVVKNNNVLRLLTAGKHWLGFRERIEIYDLSIPFSTKHAIDVLLQLNGFSDVVEIVEVADDEICLVFVNNNFHKVLPAGRHVFWKSLDRYRFQIESIATIEIPPTVGRLLLEKQPLASYIRQYTLEPSEKGLLFVDGVFTKVLDGGKYYWWKNSTSIAVSKADMRGVALEMSGQEILTRDKAQIRINFSIHYQVQDLEKALLANKDYEKQLYARLQMLLRMYVGQLSLDELMENKTEIGKYIMREGAEDANALGVILYRAGVKDIILPGDVRDIMNHVLIAEKCAQANIIMRREETASTRSLLNTARLMEENSMLYKLKEMEYVEKIAEKVNSISLSGNGQIIDQLKHLFVK